MLLTENAPLGKYEQEIFIFLLPGSSLADPSLWVVWTVTSWGNSSPSPLHAVRWAGGVEVGRVLQENELPPPQLSAHQIARAMMKRLVELSPLGDFDPSCLLPARAGAQRGDTSQAARSPTVCDATAFQ